MLRTLALPIALLPILGTILLASQTPSRDITKSTRWRDAPAVKIIERTLRFRPDTDLGDDVRACAKIVIDMTFRNNSERTIRRVDFEIVLYSNDTQGDNDARSRVSKSEKFSYHQRLVPASTGSLLYEFSNCGLFSPVQQTVRVVRVSYDDGSG